MPVIADVKDRLENEARFNARIPWHVLSRIEALTVGQELLFTDGVAEFNEDRSHDGRIIVLTHRLLIVVEYSGASVMDEHKVGGGSTVTVTASPLTDLASISIDPDTTDASINADSTWSQDWDEFWPDGARLTLTFPESAYALPLSQARGSAHRKRMRALVPFLIEVLAS